jgi:hypothetical protein
MKTRLCVYCLFEYLRKEAFKQKMETGKIRKRAKELGG